MNNNFVMWFKEYGDEVRWLMRKNGTAAAILSFICDNMDQYNALICSQKVFMEQFSISKDTVRRCIKILKDAGFIDIVKSGTSNIYIVNYKVAWTSNEHKKEYCKFAGNMIISKSENINYQNRNHFDKLKQLKEIEDIESDK